MSSPPTGNTSPQSPKPESPKVPPEGTSSISSVDHEEMMEALQEMKEPIGDAAPVDTAPADETSFFSVPEDEYAIADEDILATTSHEVFNPHAVPPPEITEADVVVPQPVLEEVPVIVEPEPPEPESSISAPEQSDVPIVAQAEVPPPEPTVTEQIQPELAAVETGDPPEIAPGSDSSSEIELDLDNVGHIPENMGPPPRSGASAFFHNLGVMTGFIKPDPVVAEPKVPEPVVAPKAELGLVGKTLRAGIGGGLGVTDWTFGTNLRPGYEASVDAGLEAKAAQLAADAAAKEAPPVETQPQPQPDESAPVDAVRDILPVPADEVPTDDNPESLHDFVAAATKPGKPEEDTFTTSLESSTKGAANVRESIPLNQLRLTDIHPAIAEMLPKPDAPPEDIPLPLFEDLPLAIPLFGEIPLPDPVEHDGSSMVLDPSAYPDGIVDTAEPIPRTSNKLIPTIPMVGPVDLAGEISAMPLIVAAKDTSPFVPVAVAPKDGMAKFLKPAGLAVAVSAAVGGLVGAIWIGNTLLAKFRKGRSKRRKAGKQRQRRHVRDWTMHEG